MPLTQDERTELELECANAKHRCKEAWQVLQAIEKIAKTYFRIHDHWREKFEKADRKLAMEDRLRKIEKGKKPKSILDKLSKEQIIAIAEELAEEGGENS